MKYVLFYISFIIPFFAFNAEWKENLMINPLIQKKRKVKNFNTSKGKIVTFYAKLGKPRESKESVNALNDSQKKYLQKTLERIETFQCAHQLSLITENSDSIDIQLESLKSTFQNFQPKNSNTN